MKKRKDTVLTHAGNHPDANHGVVNPPVYHASTIVFPTVKEFEERGHNPYEGVQYGRTGTPTTMAFEEAITAMHKGFKTVAYPSGLAAQRIKLKEPDAHMVLPEVISKEPLGPVVAHGDDQWFDIVKWTLYALIEAEELGVNKTNVHNLKANSTNPNIKRLLGAEGDTGKNLGLSKSWAYDAIKTVGNYGEMFNNHLGPNTALKLPRGVNASWKNGGLMYAMPVR